MSYLLDTNVISDFIRNPRGAAAERIRRVGESNLGASAIVSAELLFGAAKSGSARLRTRVEEALSAMPVLPFAPPADAVYARIRAHLEAAGAPIGGNDLLIAAHALALDLCLVTANRREFARVPGLRCENWLE